MQPAAISIPFGAVTRSETTALYPLRTQYVVFYTDYDITYVYENKYSLN